MYDRRVIRRVGLVAIAMSSVAHADSHVEASGFVGAVFFGQSIGLGNSYAPDQIPGTSALFGARFGFYPWTADPDEHELDLGLEAEVGFAPATTSGDVVKMRDSYFAPVFAWRAHLLARMSGSSVRPFLLAGAGGMSVASSSPFMDKESDPIYYWGPGIDLPVGEATSLRFDLRQGVMPSRDGGWTLTYELQFGVSGTFGVAVKKRVEPVVAVLTPPPAPETDTDGDGFPDRLDECPQERGPDKGCPELDSDGDGIPDKRDACPTEPEDRDGFEDADGCPDPDNDKDGVLDAADKCPDKPETRNGFEDADGCPDEVPADLAASLQVTITFEAKRARLTAKAKKALAPVIAALRTYRDVHLRITGRGASDLGKRRAEGVKWFLVDQGVLAERITTLGGSGDAPEIELSLQ